MNWIDVIIGILVSIIGGLLIVIFLWVGGRIKNPFKTMRYVIRLYQRLDSYGLSNFYANRADYFKYRDADTLPDYLGLAKKTVKVAGYWMAHGIEIEGVSDKILDLIRSPREINVTIALINPKAPYIDSLASYLNINKAELLLRIENALMALYNARNKLNEEERRKFKIKVYNTLPIASAILIDPEDKNGRIQIDLKLYKRSRHDSFSFEIRGKGKELYDKFVRVWDQLIEDSEDFDPKKHLVNLNDIDTGDKTLTTPSNEYK